MPINDKNVVGDLFWANMAAEQVYNSFEKRAKAVTDLKAVIAWVYTIFTAGGVIAIFFKPEQYSTAALVFLGIGFAVLVVAYYLATTAAFPVPMELRPNEPEIIRAAFTEAILKNTTRFQTAGAVTFSGFLFIAVGTLINFAQPQDKKENKANKEAFGLSFNASIENRDTTTYIPVTVNYKPKTTVDISVTTNPEQSTSADTVHGSKKTCRRVFQTDSLGLIYASFPFPKTAVKFFRIVVTAKEKESDGDLKEIILTREIIPVKEPKD